MGELRPCPFCGTDLIRVRTEFRGNVSYWWEHPNKDLECWLSRTSVSDTPDFISIWNRRADLRLPPDLLNRVREAVYVNPVTGCWLNHGDRMTAELLRDILEWGES